MVAHGLQTKQNKNVKADTPIDNAEYNGLYDTLLNWQKRWGIYFT